ncbi:MAG: hypothetical protein MK180_00960 [Rhodobacteraceae bacterium]|nr:hypothetical protein [Paracoccaceae bacterium]
MLTKTNTTLSSLFFFIFLAPSVSAQSELRSILSGDIRNGFEAAREVNVRNSDAMGLVTIDGTAALRLSLEYAWKGGNLDWQRLGAPGFAQRLQFREKPRKRMGSGQYWYTVSFFLPSSNKRVRGHTLSLVDMKHHHAARKGSVPTLSFNIADDGNFHVVEAFSSR